VAVLASFEDAWASKWLRAALMIMSLAVELYIAGWVFFLLFGGAEETVLFKGP